MSPGCPLPGPGCPAGPDTSSGPGLVLSRVSVRAHVAGPGRIWYDCACHEPVPTRPGQTPGTPAQLPAGQWSRARRAQPSPVRRELSVGDRSSCRCPRSVTGSRNSPGRRCGPCSPVSASCCSPRTRSGPSSPRRRTSRPSRPPSPRPSPRRPPRPLPRPRLRLARATPAGSSVTPPEVTDPAESRWRSLDKTGNVRLLHDGDPDRARHRRPRAGRDRSRRDRSRRDGPAEPAGRGGCRAGARRPGHTTPAEPAVPTPAEVAEPLRSRSRCQPSPSSPRRPPPPR